MLLGCALMGESLTWTTGAGLIVILIGVAAINQTDSQGALSRLRRLQPIQNDGSNGPLTIAVSEHSPARAELQSVVPNYWRSDSSVVPARTAIDLTTATIQSQSCNWSRSMYSNGD